MDFPHAPLAEINIADSQRLIHEQDLGINMDRDCEGKANRHAAGIGLNRLIDKATNFRKRSDVGITLIDFLYATSRELRRSDTHFPTREVGIETRSRVPGVLRPGPAR